MIEPGSEELWVLPTEVAVERCAHPFVSTEARLFARVRGAITPDDRAASPALELQIARQTLSARDPAADAPDPAERAELSPLLAATLTSLAQAHTTAQDLRRCQTARGTELARALERADEELRGLGRYRARAALTPALLSSAPARDLSSVLPRRIRLRGVSDFSAGRVATWLAIHDALRSRGGGVTVALPRLERDTWTTELAASLEARLAALPDAFEIDWFDPGPAASVSVVEAHGTAAEARAITAEILRVLEGGAQPDQIAVVVPGPDEALLGPLRAAFAEAGLPLSEAYGPPLEQAPEARAFLSLVSMVASKLDRDAIVELLRTPGLHAGSLVQASDEPTARARARLLAQALTRLPVTQTSSTSPFVEALASGPRDPSQSWMPAAMERLGSQIQALRGARSRGDAIAALLSFAARLRIGDPSAAEVEQALRAEGHGPGSLAMVAIAGGAVALRAICDTLRDMGSAAALTHGDRDPADFTAISRDLLQLLQSVRTAARGGAGRAGAIRVGSASELGDAHLELVVVARASRQSYARTPAPSLLDERTRRALPPERRPPGPRSFALSTELELAWIELAAKRVVFTYLISDDDGRTADPPHPRAQDALRAGAQRRVEPASRLAATASALSTLGQELRALADGASPDGELGRVVTIERERTHFFMSPGEPPHRYSGAIDAAQLTTLAATFGGLEPSRGLGVGAVERVRDCAFKAFGERVLGARRQDIVEDALSPLERGDLLHRALFAVFESQRELAPSLTLDQRMQIARARAERECAPPPGAGPIRKDAFARTIDDACTVLRGELTRASELRYALGERAFGVGLPDPWGPLLVPLRGGRTLHLVGRIDRIDLAPDRSVARVVDYKLGRAKPRALGERDLQVPLYGLVAKRLDVPAVEGVYASVERGGRVTLKPPPSKSVLDEQLLARTLTVVDEVMSAFLDGDVSPRPSSPRSCSRCQLRGLCRRPAVTPSEEDDGAP